MTIKVKTSYTAKAIVCITKPGTGKSSAVPFAGKKKGHKVSTARKNSQIAKFIDLRAVEFNLEGK